MIEADRLISAGTTLPEDVADRAIRPKLLEEYVGQPQVRSQMEIFIKEIGRASCRERVLRLV